MKVPYKFIFDRLKEPISIDEISDKFFQLGHEHTIDDDVFDFELTPNRGDCISLNGLLRELKSFYDLNNEFNIYNKPIPDLEINFSNKAVRYCPHISFLKIEINKNSIKKNYKDYLNDYFLLLGNKKINFFTDISNYISYELGQPTHCYDSTKINDEIVLEISESEETFTTLLDNKIELSDKNLIFKSKNEIINLAGIMGSKSTMCDENTISVIIECAYFNPEAIIGKSLKYDLQSDAAHKFERSTDPMCHEIVLRRFVQIVEDHSELTNVEIATFSENYVNKKIPFDLDKINKILGTNISEDKYKNILKNLGFKVSEFIIVPSWRNDIETQNDLSEEAARVIGYDTIGNTELNITSQNSGETNLKEKRFVEYLVDNGFNEIVNFPFSHLESKNSVLIDNPIDSTKSFLRDRIKESLIDNMLYNERRQQDSIKFFEMSEIYKKEQNKISKVTKLGIIVSGRKGKDYKSFNKNMDQAYLTSIFSKFIDNFESNLIEIKRDELQTKKKSKIFYIELTTNKITDEILNYKKISNKPTNFAKFKTVHDYPSIFRDLSFSVKKFEEIEKLEKLILNFKSDILHEVFVFDYFFNENTQEVKIGFRFRFHSDRTLTDDEVDKVVNDIIIRAIEFKNVTLPGLINESN